MQVFHRCISEEDAESKECFHCQECDKNFTRKLNLNKHLKSVHNFEIDIRQTILCPLCEDSFQTVVFLDKHLVAIHNVILNETDTEFASMEGNFFYSRIY